MESVEIDQLGQMVPSINGIFDLGSDQMELDHKNLEGNLLVNIMMHKDDRHHSRMCSILLRTIYICHIFPHNKVELLNKKIKLI